VLGRDLQRYFPSFYPRKKEKRTYFYKKRKRMIKINKHPQDIENMNTRIPSGFTMIFENGNTISVQFGDFNYGSNRDTGSKEQATTAEVAIWNKHGQWWEFRTGEKPEEDTEPDFVKGWCDADEVAKWITFAATVIF